MKKRGLTFFLSIFYVCSLLAETNGDSLAENLFKEGKAKFMIGDYVNALDKLRASLSLNSSNTEARLLKATAEFNLKSYKESEKDCELLLEISPKAFLAWNMKACCEEKQDQFKKACTDFDKCLQLNPNYTEAWLNKGALELRLKRYDKAITDFTELLKIQPHCENAYYLRGKARYESGDQAGACADWKNIEDPDEFENLESLILICK